MELQIRGTCFIVDHEGKSLASPDGTRRIPYSVMEQCGFSMLFLYDQKAETFFNNDWSGHPTDEHIAMIRIPDSDRMIKMDRGEIPKEPARELPKINLVFDRFFVDAIEQELREVKNPSNRIPFRAMSDKITHIALAYDTAKKNVVQGSREEIDRNPAVQHLKLPTLIEMDPQLMLDVMKANAFEARRDLEQRMKAFEEQWARHTLNTNPTQNEIRKLGQSTKLRSKR